MTLPSYPSRIRRGVVAYFIYWVSYDLSHKIKLQPCAFFLFTCRLGLNDKCCVCPKQPNYAMQFISYWNIMGQCQRKRLLMP